MASHGSQHDERADRIEALIEEVATCRLAAEDLRDEQVIAEHPDLMPELAEKLEQLASVIEARRRAGEPTRDTEPTQDDARDLAAGDDSDETTLPAAITRLSDSLPGYSFIREIHRGGQGVVYQAIQKSTNREVAVKVMKEGPFAGPSDKARFEREALILAQLKHPNIVTIHDSGIAGEVHYFVMDYISGHPLDVYLAAATEKHGGTKTRRHEAREPGKGSRDRGDRPGLSVDSALRLFQKICEAVNAAHLRGVIHRDLKPGNILIDAEGQPHLLDFGLAKVALSGFTGGDAHPTQTMTMAGQFVGSLPWASPEQAEAAPGKIDVRTDVYSLGVILYQMLTGKFPYEVVGNMRDVLDRIIKAEPARPSTVRKQINDEVETIVLKCLSKERQRRYQTAGELGRDIVRYLAGEAIEAKRDSFGYVLRKSLRRYRVVFGVAAAFIMLITGSAITSTVLWRRAEEQRRIADAETSRADQEKKVARAVNDFLTKDLLAAVAPSSKSGKGKDVLMRDVLDEAAERIEQASTVGGRFEEMPVVEAAIRATLGWTYRLLGAYAEAEPHLERAHLLRRRELGEEHPDTLGSMTDLGLLYDDQGRYDEAKLLCVKTLEISKRVLGEEHPRTLSSMGNLAKLYWRLGRYDEAESMYGKTLEIQKRVLGEEDTNTLSSMNSLAILYARQGRFDEAEVLFVKALEIRKRVLGEEHPETLTSMNNLAILYRRQKRSDEAERLYVKTLEIKRRVLGEEHPSTLKSMNNLAILYKNQGRYDEAEPLHGKTLEIQKRVLGKEHPDTLAAMNNLGNLYFDQGRYDEAEPLHVQSLEIHKRVLGEEHPSTLISMKSLLNLYEKQGRTDDARPLVRALQEAKRKQADRPEASSKEKNTLARELLTSEPADLRDPETALRLARDACAMTDNANPGYLDTLALAQHRTGDTLAAIETEKKALSLLPPDAPERGDYEATIARFEAALEKADTQEDPGGE